MNLNAVNLIILSPNTISKLQSIDQNIIQNLEVFNRKRIIRKIIIDIEKKTGKQNSILKMVWEMLNEVSNKTVENYWRQAGFSYLNVMNFSYL